MDLHPISRLRNHSGPRSGRRPAVRFFGLCLLSRLLAPFHKQRMSLLLLTALLLFHPSVLKAANPGDLILNTAQLSTAEDGTVSSSVTVQVAWRTSSTLELLQHHPGGSPSKISSTAFATSSNPAGAFNLLTSPTLVGSSIPLDLNLQLPLVAAEFFHQGNPIFLRLTDPDQNLDSSLPDTVLVTVSCSTTADTELLRLTETGPSSGVFTGFLQTRAGAVGTYDGTLSVQSGAQIQARYVDVADGSDASASAVLVDPYGVIFNSRTGQPVDGVSVSLVDAATGNPATVFADDGVTFYPATVSSGGSVTDGGGTLHTFAAGNYRFPLVPPGNYRLVLTPPAGFSAPSAITIVELQSLPGAPYALLNPGSYGGVFTVDPGPPVKVDLPVDPGNTALWVRKTTPKADVAIGDFLSYQVQVENTLTLGMPGVRLLDQLPLGFRYQAGSMRKDGVKTADPTIGSDGRSLTYQLGNMAPLATQTLSYVVEVGAGARTGKALNRATAASSDGFGSNRATATVTVRDDLLRSRTLLMGEVTEGRCDQPADSKPQGVAGVDIYLEDGSFVQTDSEGRFHFEGVRPGVHVVQLDPASLPAGYQPVACNPNSRFAGNTFSQFVDLQGGTLWRTDFRVMRVASSPPAAIAKSPAGNSSPVPDVADTKVSTAQGILSHQNGQLLVDRINAVRIRLEAPLKPRLLLDGQEIPEKRIGFRMDEASGSVLYSYIGIDFGAAGKHKLQLQGLDPFGNARFEQSLDLIRTGDIAGLKLLEAGNNIADNTTPVRLRIALLDQAGRVIKAPATLELRECELIPSGEAEPKESIETKTVQVDDEGNITFRPTHRSGTYRGVLAFNDLTLPFQIYVGPHLRDWILVGLAEGTVGYNVVSGNMENLSAAEKEDSFYQQGRLAFFAKGKVLGKWLLTLSYDSTKSGGQEQNSLFQTIDPGRYYTLYGDGSVQGYQAASREKLYLKLEREQFYLLFGDFDTGLTVTELSRYSRSLTGLKAELQTERAAVNLFGSQTAQVFVKDELQGDGTSGLYRLSRNNLVLNSEKITLETRDRFRSEVILGARTLQRHLDYDIDYQAGTLFFKEPVFSQDENFNPIVIVIDYETTGGSAEAFNFGGRAAYQVVDDRLEIGATRIQEDQLQGSGQLSGVDLSWKVTENLEFKGEMAASDSTQGNTARDGTAYLAELKHRGEKLDGRIYVRENSQGFGLGQQNAGESGTTKMGAEGRYRVDGKTTLTSQGYRQQGEGITASRDLAEVQAGRQLGPINLQVGARRVADQLQDGSSETSTQAMVGGSWRGAWDRLTLRLNHDQTLESEASSRDFPTRTTLGADLRLTEKLSLFGAQEFSWVEDGVEQKTRMGIRARTAPWRGGQMASSLEQQFQESGSRLFANFGLKQSWQISQRWSVDAGLDRSQTLKETFTGTATTTTPTGATTGEFTAVSLGANKKMAQWTWWNRLELRTSDTNQKWGVTSGLHGEPQPGLALAARVQTFAGETESGDETTNGDLHLGIAYRPSQSRWILLNRVDFRYDRQKGAITDTSSWRLVNNLNANTRINRRTQLALQYGVKYVVQTIDHEEYSGLTDTVGAELRYDINSKWDIGARSSVLHSYNSGQLDYSAGVSVGHNLVQNAWVSLGYNVTGYQDPDFAQGNFTAQGPYVQVKIKLDQQNVQAMLGVKEPAGAATIKPAPAPKPVADEPQAVLTSYLSKEPVDIRGSVEMPALFVNGRQALLPGVDIRLATAGDQVLKIEGSKPKPLSFAVMTTPDVAIDHWTCRIFNHQGESIRSLTGNGPPPAGLEWDGKTSAGEPLKGGEIFFYQIETKYRSGATATSPRRLFGIDRSNPVSLSLTGGAFQFNQTELSPEARQALREVASVLRNYPEEKIVVEGHSDSVGSEQANLLISQHRAESAAAFLIQEEKIAAERILVHWYGKSRPVASNATEEGREVNRRVDVKGAYSSQERAEIRDQYRADPQVKINDNALNLDDYGRFAHTLPEGTESFRLAMTDSRGRGLQAEIQLPTLEILEAREELQLPLGSQNENYRFTNSDLSSISAKESFLVYRLRARTEAGNQVWVDQQLVTVAADGTLTLELELKPGDNLFGVLVQKPNGASRLTNLQMNVSLEEARPMTKTATKP